MIKVEDVAAVLAVIDWITAAILGVAAWRYPSTALRERAITAGALAFAATLIAVILLNRGAGYVITGEPRELFVVGSMLFVSIPGIVFIVLFVRGDFGDRA
jgi:hypothetical protein